MRPTLTRALLLAGLLLVGLMGTSEAQLVVYDSFPVGSRIDPTKWFGGLEGSDGSLSPNEETERALAGGRLRMGLTMYGGTEGDTEIFGIGRQRLRVQEPAGITTIQSKVTVNTATTQDCAANPNPTTASAKIAGTFFRDDTVAPKNREGQVIAVFGKTQQSHGTPRVFIATVFRCAANVCFDDSTVVGTTTFTTVWTTGNGTTTGIHTLTLEWDEPADLFRFTVDPGVGGVPEVRTIAYAFSDANAVGPTDFKELLVETAAAECTAGAKRANITAFFDDVMINP